MNGIKAILLVFATFVVYMTMLVLMSNWRHHHGEPTVLDVQTDLRAGK